MRASIHFMAIVCLLFLFSCVNQTEDKSKPLDDSIKNSFKANYKNESLKDLRDIFSAQAKELDHMFMLIDTKIEFTPSSATNQLNNQGVINMPNYPLVASDEIERGMIETANNYYFKQQIKSSGSSFSLQLKEDFKKPMFFGEGIDNEKYKTVLTTQMKINKMFFHDRTVINQDKISQHNADEPAIIHTIKIADSLEGQYSYTYTTKVQKIILDKENIKQKTKDGFLELKQIGNSSATLLLSEPTGRVLSIAGINDNGQIIESNSSSLNSVPSVAKQKVLKEFSKLLNKAVKNIDAGKYKTTKDLLDDIAQQLPNGLNDKEVAVKNTVIASYHFYQNVNKVIVYFAEETKTVNRTVTVRNDDAIFSGIALAEGDKPGMFGIVDAEGNWLLKPSYKNLVAINSYYYKSCPDKDTEIDCSYYRFDIKSKKMISFDQTKLKPYALAKALDQSHVSFYKADKKDEYASAGAEKGMLDKDGNIILKPDYLVAFITGKYILSVKDSPDNGTSYALRSLDGKIVIPPSPNEIFDDNHVIFSKAKAGSKNELTKYNVLDANEGKDFLPAGAFSLDGRFNEKGLILVKSGNNKYYLDRKGVKKPYTLTKN